MATGWWRRLLAGPGRTRPPAGPDPAAGPPADRSPAAEHPARPAWQDLPPVQRALPPLTPATDPARFERSLVTRASMVVLSRLEHGSGPQAPAGRVEGLVRFAPRGLPVQRLLTALDGPRPGPDLAAGASPAWWMTGSAPLAQQPASVLGASRMTGASVPGPSPGPSPGPVPAPASGPASSGTGAGGQHPVPLGSEDPPPAVPLLGVRSIVPPALPAGSPAGSGPPQPAGAPPPAATVQRTPSDLPAGGSSAPVPSGPVPSIPVWSGPSPARSASADPPAPRPTSPAPVATDPPGPAGERPPAPVPPGPVRRDEPSSPAAAWSPGTVLPLAEWAEAVAAAIPREPIEPDVDVTGADVGATGVEPGGPMPQPRPVPVVHRSVGPEAGPEPFLPPPGGTGLPLLPGRMGPLAGRPWTPPEPPHPAPDSPQPAPWQPAVRAVQRLTWPGSLSSPGPASSAADRPGLVRGQADDGNLPPVRPGAIAEGTRGSLEPAPGSAGPAVASRQGSGVPGVPEAQGENHLLWVSRLKADHRTPRLTDLPAAPPGSTAVSLHQAAPPAPASHPRLGPVALGPMALGPVPAGAGPEAPPAQHASPGHTVGEVLAWTHGDRTLLERGPARAVQRAHDLLAPPSVPAAAPVPAAAARSTWSAAAADEWGAAVPIDASAAAPPPGAPTASLEPAGKAPMAGGPSSTTATAGIATAAGGGTDVGGGGVGGSGGVGGAAALPLDELVRRLFDPLAARLKAELRLDRERAGLLTDPRR